MFCDALPFAYVAVAYFHYQNEFGRINVSFIMSKNRVVPLKKLMLLQLDLMTVLIGAQIEKYICRIFDDLINRTVHGSDLEIALYWAKGCAR